MPIYMLYTLIFSSEFKQLTLRNLVRNIVFLQEIIKKKKWQGQVFLGSASRDALRVFIKLSHFQVVNSIDPTGRSIILHRFFLCEKLKLVTVYGPNKDDPLFISDLVKSLLVRKHLILQADLNPLFYIKPYSQITF